MNEYNVFILDDNGHIIDNRVLKAASDNEAVVTARQLVSGRDIEILAARSARCDIEEKVNQKRACAETQSSIPEFSDMSAIALTPGT